MLKRMIFSMVLIVGEALAGGGQQAIDLKADQAQVHGLYSFDENDSIKEALLIFEITPDGKTIFNQCRDVPFKACVKKDKLGSITDGNFIDLNNGDDVTVGGDKVTLGLSSETRGKIRSVKENFHIRLQKKIEKTAALLLWQAEGGDEVEKEKDGDKENLFSFLGLNKIFP